MQLEIARRIQVDLVLSHEAAGAWGVEERLFVDKKAGESLTHVLMKLCSYMAFYRPGLAIEVSADQHYKPDLVRFNDDNEPVQWIDCGKTALRKLDKITKKNRLTRITIVKPTRYELERYKALADKRLELPERVDYVTFRRGFLEELAALMGPRVRIEANVPGAGGHLYIMIGGRPIDTPIVRLTGPADQ